MKQIIYVEHTDNIATIREKLERAQASEVLLVVPSRYAVLRDLVNLKLLKRYAQHLAIDLALVVKDRATQVLAREVGFVLLPNVDKGRQISLQGRGPRRQAAGQGDAPDTGRGAAGRGPSFASAGQSSLLSRLLSLLFLLGVAGLLGAGFVYIVLPSASLTLVPAVEPVEAEMEVVAMPGLAEIDYGKGQIPANIISVELEARAETPATDKRDIPDAHAEGSIVFANKTKGPVTVPKGTMVRTSAGAPIRFYTVTEVKLPDTWGAHERVGIIAVDPGPAGNIKRLTISEVEGDLAFQVDVINDEPTRGGSVKRVSVVNAEDMGRVKNTLLARLQQDAYSKLKTKLAETEFISAETVTVAIVEEKYDKGVGNVADNLGLQLRIRASGTVVGSEEANTLILRLLERQVRGGYSLLPESLRFQPGAVLAVEGASVRFRMKASGLAVSDIKEAEVRSGIAGKPAPEALQYLLDRWDFEESPKLEIKPEWIDRVPLWPYRIAVNIKTPQRK